LSIRLSSAVPTCSGSARISTARRTTTSSGRSPYSARPRALAGLDHQPRQVGLLELDRQRPLVGARDDQQLLGEAHQPVGLVRRRLQRRLHLLDGTLLGQRRLARSAAIRAARAAARLVCDVNWRSCTNDRSSRAIMSLSSSPSAAISSRDSGTGSALPARPATASRPGSVRSTGRVTSAETM
jgi:hypothetical protein